jgi:hypothetical protein
MQSYDFSVLLRASQMPTVARDFRFRGSCIFAELAAVLLAGRRHTEAGKMRALLGFICHLLVPPIREAWQRPRQAKLSQPLSDAETTTVCQQFEHRRICALRGGSGNDGRALQASLYVTYFQCSIALKMGKHSRGNKCTLWYCLRFCMDTYRYRPSGHFNRIRTSSARLVTRSGGRMVRNSTMTGMLNAGSQSLPSVRAL